jgi:hypothetical protein
MFNRILIIIVYIWKKGISPFFDYRTINKVWFDHPTSKQISSAVKLSIPCTFDHWAVLKGGFAEVDATGWWGPHVNTSLLSFAGHRPHSPSPVSQSGGHGASSLPALAWRDHPCAGCDTPLSLHRCDGSCGRREASARQRRASALQLASARRWSTTGKQNFPVCLITDREMTYIDREMRN